MKITKKWMEKHKACKEGIDWVISTGETDPVKLINIAIKSNDSEIMRWAIWGMCRVFKNKQIKVRFAVYCAENVIKIYENKYPKDKRPRRAIQAAKRYLNNSSIKAADAADAANAAAYAARAAANAAAYAARAAYAAAYAADAAAAYAANAAAYAAAANAADAAYDDARKELYIKFLKHGKRLLKGE